MQDEFGTGTDSGTDSGTAVTDTSDLVWTGFHWKFEIGCFTVNSYYINRLNWEYFIVVSYCNLFCL